MRSTDKHLDQQKAILQAVAGQLSATWNMGDDSADAYLTLAGKRIPVEIATLKSRGKDSNKHGLRFDKVATRLIERLRSSLEKTVPDGMTVLLTVTAPILLPSKTAAALEAKIPALLEKSPTRDWKQIIHGNSVQVRILRDESRRTAKLIGFVHNPDSDPRVFFDMTQQLLQLIAKPEAKRRLHGLIS